MNNYFRRVGGGFGLRNEVTNVSNNSGCDVILFQPTPSSGVFEYRVAMLPLGLLCCASALEKSGYRVSIIDQSADPQWKTKLLSDVNKKPIAFGITCMTGPQIMHALAVCKLVRDRCPDIPIIWGGVHASLLPEQTLENQLVDIAVVGEGEDTLPELIEALKAKTPLQQVRGIAFREDGQYVFTGTRPFINLDTQPPLALHLVNVNRYREHMLGRHHIHMHTSRGCTFECAFCWDPVVHKRIFRKMDPPKVLESIHRIVSEYGIRGFLFHDDNFFLDLAWARSVIEGIVRFDLDLSLGKLFIRADTLCRMDDEFLKLLVRAGVKRLVMGVESGSQRINDLLKKHITLDQVLEANRKLLPYPIHPAFMFMMGIPTETSEEVAQSIRFADRLITENPKATRTFNLYMPYPGTELFKFAVQNGLREPEALTEWAQFNYHKVFKESPWILPETEKLVEVMNFALMCSKHDNAFGGFRRQDAGSRAVYEVIWAPGSISSKADGCPFTF